MTSTIIDVFAQAGYSVTTRMVDRVDNQGEPCDSCAIEGRYIDANVYGVPSGSSGRVVLDCCAWCVPSTINIMNPDHAVTVELGDSMTDYDDRMHGPDCECVHPDGA